MLCFLRSGQPVTKLEFGQFEDLQKVSKENNSKNFMTTRRNVLLHHLQKQCVEQFWLFWDVSRRSLLKLRLFSVLKVRQDDTHHDLQWRRPACITVVQLCSSIIMYNYDFTTLVVALLLGSLHKQAKEKRGENYHL